MIRRLVQFLIYLPLAVILIVLSVANRHPVTISLDPFNGTDPAVSVTLPLFLIIFAALLVGVVVGGTAAWLSQGKWRRRARVHRQEAARARYRLDETRRKQADEAGAPGLPVLRRT
ncbi:LapA family protein [Microbaculum marinum]|uniref:LapA family protein n=1 Tax=Microbaculum marinum TaxID=1764581 RepID=A0AAW9RSS3_9HYPH